MQTSGDGKTLDQSLSELTQITSANREMVLKEVLMNRKKRTDLPLTRLFVTKEETDAASQLKTIKKRIEHLISKHDSAADFYKSELHLIPKKFSSTKNKVILALCEVVEQVNDCDQEKQNNKQSQN